jgi:predicted ATPase/class 3 adenylate cyclase/Tfp pilus assembly protein PilF
MVSDAEPTASTWALLLTDMVDSTGLNARLGDAAMATVWHMHDRLVRDLQRAWNGREIDKTDGMLTLFARADDAAACVSQMHAQIAAKKLPFTVRAAIHVGALVLRANAQVDVALGAKPIEVNGLALPLTARIMGLARGGQTLLSSDARAALEAPPASARSIGFWRLQGVTEPEELFELAAGADAFLGVPNDGPKAYRVTRRGEHWDPVRDLPHSLPAERDSFVGRQAVLSALNSAFDAGARLVCVHGLGGVGKTRLATHFAWAMRGDHAGGSWFCDLSQARSLDGLLFAVAQGLGIPLGTDDPVVQIGHAFAGRGDCLVVLDNFEQVNGYAEQTVGRWLVAAPRARFLVTTREVLGIPGEHVLSLDPLPASDGATLFMLRASAARVGFQPDAEDKSAIEQLVRLIDGLPLAIELAAARVRVMPPRLLAARLYDRFALASARGGRLDRQSTLRTTLDWSWDMLADPERATLARLSVFEGGFTADAAAAVLGIDGADASAWVDNLQALIDKSLLCVAGSGRYAQLETVREYAGAQLRREGSFAGSGPSCADAARRAHWRYFASLDEQVATAERGIETNNLVAACRAAADSGDAPSAACCVAVAWSALRRSGPYRTAVELARSVLVMQGLDDASQCAVHGVIGDALESQGETEAARDALRLGLGTATRGVPPEVRGRLLVTLGNRETVDGDFAQARAHLDEALALADAAGSEKLRMHALNALGAHHDLQARWKEAQQCYEQALVLARALGDNHMQAGILGNLGGVHRDKGRPGEALSHYEASLALACELGDRRWEGSARCNVGLQLQEQGERGPARQQFEQALALAREMGHVRLAYTVLCNLGILLDDEGRLDDAGEHFERAVLAARDSANRRAEGQFSGYLAVNQARRGLVNAARATIAAAEQLLKDARGDPQSQALLWSDRAEVEWLARDRGLAVHALAQAREVAEALGCAADSELGRRLVALEAAMPVGA